MDNDKILEAVHTMTDQMNDRFDTIDKEFGEVYKRLDWQDDQLSRMETHAHEDIIGLLRNVNKKI